MELLNASLILIIHLIPYFDSLLFLPCSQVLPAGSFSFLLTLLSLFKTLSNSFHKHTCKQTQATTKRKNLEKESILSENMSFILLTFYALSHQTNIFKSYTKFNKINWCIVSVNNMEWVIVVVLLLTFHFPSWISE